MSDGGAGPVDRAGTQVPPDEEFARAYSLGYEEGIRTALKEMVEHAARGHTAAELRMLIESRIARLSEEVEAKRRSLLSPPRRTVWSHPNPPPRPWSPGLGAPPKLRLSPGVAYLVREDQPRRAIELLRSSSDAPRVLLISRHPPELPQLPSERRFELRPSGAESATSSGSLGDLSGRIREALIDSPGSLIYLDAIEFLLTTLSADTVLRFVGWLIDRSEEFRAALIVSVDPEAMEARDFSRLTHLFRIQA